MTDLKPDYGTLQMQLEQIEKLEQRLNAIKIPLLEQLIQMQEEAANRTAK
jgi:hypothetical protein